MPGDPFGVISWGKKSCVTVESCVTRKTKRTPLSGGRIHLGYIEGLSLQTSPPTSVFVASIGKNVFAVFVISATAGKPTR